MHRLQGFTSTSLCFSNECSSPNQIFIKENSIRKLDVKRPPGRTLFAINIPPYASEDALSNAFSAAGKISAVFLQNVTENPSGFKTAYIVFEKRDGLLKALKLEQLNPLTSNEKTVLVGLNKWVREYNTSVYDQEKLNDEVNAFIKDSDKQEAQKKENEKQEDDGWTVVKKKGRNPGISRKQSVENKLIQKNKLKSRKKELKNFYTFQLKEEKLKNIISFRKSYQDSKEKVTLMKQMRNFKPL